MDCLRCYRLWHIMNAQSSFGNISETSVPYLQNATLCMNEAGLTNVLKPQKNTCKKVYFGFTQMTKTICISSIIGV